MGVLEAWVRCGRRGLEVTTGYKIRGGKPIRRTEEEQAELDQLKLERSKSESEAEGSKATGAEGNFIMITDVQLLKLQLKSSPEPDDLPNPAKSEFRHRGNSFLMPTEPLLKEGFSRRHTGRACPTGEERV